MDIIRNIFSIKIKDSTKRFYYLDVVRGILIILVLYHHSSAPLATYVLKFHMPALFILSGYTEYLLNKEINFLSYIKLRFLRLIAPYFCFELLNLLLYTLIQCLMGRISFSFSDAFVSILTCINNSYVGLYGRLWFLPVMFVCSIFSYLIKNFFSKNKLSIIAIWCLIMFILSYISYAIIQHRLLFAVDTAFLATAFFLIGHLCGDVFKVLFEIKKHTFDMAILIIFGTLFVLVNKYANPICHMYINEYNDFPLMVIGAISGTVMIFILTKLAMLIIDKIQFFQNVIIWYSVNSLTIFPVHLTIKVLSIPLLSYIGIYHWSLLFIEMLVLSIPIVNTINSYFPFMYGKFKRTK